MKLIKILALFSLICLLVMGCTTTTNEDTGQINNSDKEDTKEVNNADEQGRKENNEDYDNQENELQAIRDTLNTYEIKTAAVGYDEDGNIVAWVRPEESLFNEALKLNSPKPVAGFQFLFSAKEIFDDIPNIYSLFVYDEYDTDSFFLNLTKDTYDKNIIKDLPDEPRDFYSIEAPLNELVDFYFEYHDYDDDELPIIDVDLIENKINESFRGEVKESKRFSIDGVTCSDGLEISVNLYENITNSYSEFVKNLAKTFVLSVGRYENYNWGSILNTELMFYYNDEKIFSVLMFQEDYREWLESGLDYKDVLKYSTVEIMNSQYEQLLNSEIISNENDEKEV